MFSTYEEEFLDLLKTITSDISRVAMYESDAGKKKSTIAHIETVIDQAEQALQQMEVHSRSHDAPTRKQLKSKISSYRSGLQSAKSDFRQARRRGERADLLETDGMLLGSSTRDQKRSLMDSSDRLSSSTETLKASKRVLEETHEVAVGITDELHRHREVILSSKRKTDTVSGTLGAARQLLHRMTRRECRRKVCLAFIVLVLISVICLIVYYWLIASDDTTGSSSKAKP
jgi:hypothetical protein